MNETVKGSNTPSKKTATRTTKSEQQQQASPGKPAPKTSPSKQASPEKAATPAETRKRGRNKHEENENEKNTPKEEQEDEEEVVSKKAKASLSLQDSRKSVSPALIKIDSNNDKDTEGDETQLNLDLKTEETVVDNDEVDEKNSPKQEEEVKGKTKRKKPKSKRRKSSVPVKKEEEVIPSTQVLVSNIEIDVSTASLTQHFQDCGEILKCRVNRKNTRKWTHSFVIYFQKFSGAKCAVTTMNKTEFQGRKMRVIYREIPDVCTNKYCVILRILGEKTTICGLISNGIKSEMSKLFGKINSIKVSDDRRSAIVQFKKESAVVAALKTKTENFKCMDFDFKIEAFQKVDVNRVLLFGVTPELEEMDIETVISTHCTVVSTTIPTDNVTGDRKTYAHVELKVAKDVDKLLAMETIKIKDVVLDILPMYESKYYYNPETKVYFRHPACIFAENVESIQETCLKRLFSCYGSIDKIRYINYGHDAMILFNDKASAEKALQSDCTEINEMGIEIHAVDGLYSLAKETKSAVKPPNQQGSPGKAVIPAETRKRGRNKHEVNEKNIPEPGEEDDVVCKKAKQSEHLKEGRKSVLPSLINDDKDTEGDEAVVDDDEVEISDEKNNIQKQEEEVKPKRKGKRRKSPVPVEKEEEVPPSTLVIVSNIGTDVTSVSLRQHFQDCGEILKCKVRHKDKTKRTHSCVIYFQKLSGAKCAVTTMNNTEFQGTKIKVAYRATPDLYTKNTCVILRILGEKSAIYGHISNGIKSEMSKLFGKINSFKVSDDCRSAIVQFQRKSAVVAALKAEQFKCKGFFKIEAFQKVEVNCVLLFGVTPELEEMDIETVISTHCTVVSTTIPTDNVTGDRKTYAHVGLKVAKDVDKLLAMETIKIKDIVLDILPMYESKYYYNLRTKVYFRHPACIFAENVQHIQETCLKRLFGCYGSIDKIRYINYGHDAMVLFNDKASAEKALQSDCTEINEMGIKIHAVDGLYSPGKETKSAVKPPNQQGSPGKAEIPGETRKRGRNKYEEIEKNIPERGEEYDVVGRNCKKAKRIQHLKEGRKSVSPSPIKVESNDDKDTEGDEAVVDDDEVEISDEENNIQKQEEEVKSKRRKLPVPVEKEEEEEVTLSTAVYVSNIGTDVTVASMRQHFQDCGEILKCKVNRGKKKWPSYSLVYFQKPSEAKCAVTTMNNTELQGVKIKVTYHSIPDLFTKHDSVVLHIQGETSTICGRICTGIKREMSELFGNVIIIKVSDDRRSAIVRFKRRIDAAAAFKTEKFKCMDIDFKIVAFQKVDGNRVLLFGVTPGLEEMDIETGISAHCTVVSTSIATDNVTGDRKTYAHVGLKDAKDVDKLLVMETIKIKNVVLDILPTYESKHYYNLQRKMYFRHPAGIFAENLESIQETCLKSLFSCYGSIDIIRYINNGHEAMILFNDKASAEKALQSDDTDINKMGIKVHAVDGLYSPEPKTHWVQGNINQSNKQGSPEKAVIPAETGKPGLNQYEEQGDEDEVVRKKTKQSPKTGPLALVKPKDDEDPEGKETQLNLSKTEESVVDDDEVEICVEEKNIPKQEKEDDVVTKKAKQSLNHLKSRKSAPPAPVEKESTRVIISNLQTDVTAASLTQHFQVCGEILKCKVKQKTTTKRTRSCVIYFQNLSGAKCAVTTMNNTQFQGLTIGVAYHTIRDLFTNRNSVILHILEGNSKITGLICIGVKAKMSDLFGDIHAFQVSDDCRSAIVRFRQSRAVVTALKTEKFKFMHIGFKIEAFVKPTPDVNHVLLFGVTPELEEKDIETVMSTHCTVLSTTIATDNVTGDPKTYAHVGLKDENDVDKLLAIETIKIKNVVLDILPMYESKHYYNPETKIYFRHPACIFTENVESIQGICLKRLFSCYGSIDNIRYINDGHDAMVLFNDKASAEKALESDGTEIIKMGIKVHAVDGVYAPGIVKTEEKTRNVSASVEKVDHSDSDGTEINKMGTKVHIVDSLPARSEEKTLNASTSAEKVHQSGGAEINEMDMKVHTVDGACASGIANTRKKTRNVSASAEKVLQSDGTKINEMGIKIHAVDGVSAPGISKTEEKILNVGTKLYISNIPDSENIREVILKMEQLGVQINKIIQVNDFLTNCFMHAIIIEFKNEQFAQKVLHSKIKLSNNILIPEKYDPAKHEYVTDKNIVMLENLAERTMEVDIWKSFYTRGEIERCFVFRKHNVSLCCGYVKFSTAAVAQQALNALTIDINGAKVQITKPTHEIVDRIRKRLELQSTFSKDRYESTTFKPNTLRKNGY